MDRKWVSEVAFEHGYWGATVHDEPPTEVYGSGRCKTKEEAEAALAVILAAAKRGEGKTWAKGPPPADANPAELAMRFSPSDVTNPKEG